MSAFSTHRDWWDEPLTGPALGDNAPELPPNRGGDGMSGGEEPRTLVSDEMVESAAAALCDADVQGIPWVQLVQHPGHGFRVARYRRMAGAAAGAVRPLIEAELRQDIDAFLADIGRSVDAISHDPHAVRSIALNLEALSERINDKRQQLRGES